MARSWCRPAPTKRTVFIRGNAKPDLTCDHLVTYHLAMDDDRVFKALADPTRRLLLDRLFERDGRTLTELESQLEMTRFGVMKHLRIWRRRAWSSLASPGGRSSISSTRSRSG